MSETVVKKRGILLRKVNQVEETKAMSVPFGDEFLEVTYNRSKYTPKFEKEIKQLMDDNLPGNMLAKMLFTLLTSWNLRDYVDTDENLSLPEDQRKTYPVPLTLDVFESLLSMEALASIVEKLAEDNRPNLKSSEDTNVF